MILLVRQHDLRTAIAKPDLAFGFRPRCVRKRQRWSALFLVPLSLCMALGPGCASAAKARLERQIGESIIFIGEEPARLAFLPARGRAVRLRSTYLPEASTVEYLEGRDFKMDYSLGTLRRTPTS